MIWKNIKRLLCNHQIEEIGIVSGLKPMDRKLEIDNKKFVDYQIVLTYCKKCGLVGVKKISSSI